MSDAEEKAILKLLNNPTFLQEKLVVVLQENKQLTEEKKQLSIALKDKESEIDALIPKVEFFDCVTKSDDWMEMATAVKVLAFPGWGRNKVFEFLRERKILRYNNEPYQEYVERGYFKTIEQIFTNSYSETMINKKTMVSQKGLDYIRKLIKAEIADDLQK